MEQDSYFFFFIAQENLFVVVKMTGEGKTVCRASCASGFRASVGGDGSN